MNAFRIVSIAASFSLAGVGCVEATPEAEERVAEVEQAMGSDGVDVAFSGCVESIGVTLVDTNAARAFLPADLILVGEGTPVTPLVVRTAHCESVSVGGRHAKAASIAQIGAVIVPPDFTGDINNYTFWYATTHNKLAQRLSDLGVAAEHVGNIDYDVELGAGSLPFHVKVPKPRDARFELDGTVVAAPTPAGSFVANWWQDDDCGGDRIKMTTTVPAIAIGSADLTLTAKPGSDLAELLGGTNAGFPALQQFNTFAGATLRAEALP